MPDRLVLIGGGARTPGVAEILSERLGLVVERLESVAVPIKGLSTEDLSDFGRAAAIALDHTASRSKRFDLRTGELRYKGHAAAIRTRIKAIAAGLLVVLLAWGFAAWSRTPVDERRAAGASVSDEDGRRDSARRALAGRHAMPTEWISGSLAAGCTLPGMTSARLAVARGGGACC